MTNPIVSVIIPCYNQGSYLFEAALSAKRAYRGPLDVIIVNDGSTESSIRRTLELVANELSDERCKIRIIHQANTGLSGARNVAIAAAEGNFIQLLDADDLLLEGKIDDQIGHFNVARSIDVSITDFIEANEQLDQFVRHDRIVGGWSYSLRDFAMSWERGFSIPAHCALIKKEVFSRIAFEEKVKAKEDWIFWTRLVATGGRIAFLGSRGAVYRIHDKSMCRSMPDLGRQWLTASTQIDAIVRDSCPDFLPKAVEWYQTAYASAAEPSNAKSSSRGDVSSTPPDFDNSTELPLKLAVARSGPVRLSIVIPIFNHFEYLRQCLDSAFSQQLDWDDGAIEVVLADDGSTDPRVHALLDRLAAERRANLRIVRSATNRGIAPTQNAAVAAAAGAYIAFLDCDDALAPNALRRAMDFIGANKGCDYFFSDRWDIDKAGKRIRLARYGGYADGRFVGDFKRDILNGMVASHLKIIRKSSFEAVSGFDPEFSGVQDWELALKLLKFGKFVYLPQPLYQHRIHEKSVTSGDRRGQFHRTNLVRRKFAPEILNLDVRKDAESKGRRSFFRGNDDIEIPALARAWENAPVTLDTTYPLTKANLWRIREFNSYIDEIVWAAPEVYAALLGYVWSPDILKRA
jgi:glycosyltransferase involved in cell wall biosynthesis